MKVHEAEMILEYCADIPCRLNIIRRQCAALDDEIDTMRGVNMDGMPRGGEPGDGPATMAVKMSWESEIGFVCCTSSRKN